MTAALALSGWTLAAALALAVAVLRRRLELVARAEHELRGPATVLGLAAEAMLRDPAARRHVRALDAELERLRTGLADLRAARHGARAPDRPTSLELEGFLRGAAGPWRPALRRSGRRLTLDWRAGRAAVSADRGRLAQAFGNLLANAAEHGSGPVELRGRRSTGGVRVEVRNTRKPAPEGLERELAPLPDRGRGLKIASAAARSAGGRLEVHSSEQATVAAIELPLDPEQPPAA